MPCITYLFILLQSIDWTKFVKKKTTKFLCFNSRVGMRSTNTRLHTRARLSAHSASYKSWLANRVYCECNIRVLLNDYQHLYVDDIHMRFIFDMWLDFSSVCVYAHFACSCQFWLFSILGCPFHAIHVQYEYRYVLCWCLLSIFISQCHSKMPFKFHIHTKPRSHSHIHTHVHSHQPYNTYSYREIFWYEDLF